MNAIGKTYRFLPIIIFLFFVIGGTAVNFFIRKNLQPIFDETAIITYLKKEVKDGGFRTFGEYYHDKWRSIWLEPSSGPADRPLQKVFYRPLQVLTVSFKTLTWSIFQEKPNIPILINAFILSLAAGFIYLLGFKLTQDHFASTGGAFLMMFSLPALTGTWVVLSGEHALVPLLMCIQMLSYCYWKENKFWGWLVPVFVIAFFGPFYKEYIAVGLFIICLAEIILHQRDWRVLGLAVPFVLHSFFPAFLVNSVFFGHPTFSSTYAKMNVVPVIVFGLYHFEAINHFLFTVPPLISLMGFVAVVAYPDKNEPVTALRILMGCLIFAFLFVPSQNALWLVSKYVCLFLILWISIAAKRIHPVLLTWFLLSWLPYLVIFFGDVHLIYAIGPLAIILLWYIKQFILRLLKSGRAASRLAAAGLICLLGVGFLDQSLNLLAAFRAFHGTNEAAAKIALDLARDTKAEKPIVLVSSTLLGNDVEYFLAHDQKRNLAVNGYTFHDAVDGMNVYEDERRFRGLIETQQEHSLIYFLDNTIRPNRLPGFLYGLEGRLKLVAEERLDVVYPFADPLKSFIPLEYSSYPGSPDHRDHVVMGKGKFYRRLQARCALWRLES